MWFFGQASPGARIALAYITVGSLTVVWTTVWYFYLQQHPPVYPGMWYLVAGLFITGLTLLVIGFGLGWIGRNARQADQPTPTPPGGKKDEKAPSPGPVAAPAVPYPPAPVAPPGIPVASVPAPNGPPAPANPAAATPGSPGR